VCRLEDCPPIAELEPLWRGLERHTDSVFLTWPWIGALVATATVPFRLARIEQGAALRGLALLGRPSPRSALFLNESGDRGIDAVMTEYNGVLAAPGDAADAARCLIEAAGPRLVLSGVTDSWQSLCAEAGLACRLVRAPQPAPYISLDRLDAEGMPPGLSRNARAQLRRSLRHFAGLDAQLDLAASVDQALGWFGEMEPLHTAYWRGRGKAGAFAAPSFAAFHRRLIATGYEEGLADMMRLSAGGATIGFLYCLRRGGTVHAYQSGFDYGDEGRWRPGLVAHLLAIRHYAAAGLARYRLLAGAARYKSSLADGEDRLIWIRTRRAGPWAGLAEAIRRGFAPGTSP
jgi:CelD/BcsL family acetyltransferase involved in cellulose biosynthesis